MTLNCALILWRTLKRRVKTLKLSCRGGTGRAGKLARWKILADGWKQKGSMRKKYIKSFRQGLI